MDMSAISKDITGQIYGKWLVLEQEKRETIKGAVILFRLCKCECGNVVWVRKGNLRNGQSTSCGCLKNQKTAIRLTKPPGETTFHAVWAFYIKNAQRRNLSWSLTKDQFKELLFSPCCYCGIENSMTTKKYHDSIDRNGIDRIDSTLGYTKGNCVSCCKWCNIAKSNRTVVEFREWLVQCVKHSAWNTEKQPNNQGVLS